MTPNLIAKAFEKIGLYPVNHSIFTPEDFMPSKASSTIAYVPKTFSDAFPSSDPAEHSDSKCYDLDTFFFLPKASLTHSS